MKQLITKANAESYCKMLEESLDKFISYCEEYPAYTKYTIHYLPARWIKQNYKDKIALHILSFASSGTPHFLDGKPAFVGQTLDFMQHVEWFIFTFNEARSPLSLTEQNELSKKYVHFDFSVKKVKTINDLLQKG